MHGIIRQRTEAPALPDFRNLGAILRILIAVNGATLLAALAREPRLSMLGVEGWPLVEQKSGRIRGGQCVIQRETAGGKARADVCGNDIGQRGL